MCSPTPGSKGGGLSWRRGGFVAWIACRSDFARERPCSCPLCDGYRCRLAKLAEAIEDGAAQLSFPLLTIGMFRAQMSSDNCLVPIKCVLYMRLSVIARCPSPLEDTLRLNGGDVAISLCGCALGGLRRGSISPRWHHNVDGSAILVLYKSIVDGGIVVHPIGHELMERA